MSMSDFKNELSDEVEEILSREFTIEVTTTKTVPNNSDGAITFPNLDTLSQKCKLIDTCVLYIDIRRSTDLNLSHKPQTVAKLYSAFVRAMTRCARHHNGHVRGIIGDRVMVLFDKENCFVNAVETAISMNSASKYVINKHFKANEVSCGIGIDSGKMLATKTGFRRHGSEQQSYRSLVWLGRPANVASKLTDIANKPEERIEVERLQVGRQRPATGFPDSILDELMRQWTWTDERFSSFLNGFKRNYMRGGWDHDDPSVKAFVTNVNTVISKPATPPILMTKAVYEGFKEHAPNASSITNNWWNTVGVKVPGYNDKIYGGDVIYSVFK